MGFGGRPPIYSSFDEMLPLLQAWEQKVASGQEVPTITGLTLALDFADKSTLYDYAKKPEFSHPLKKAITIVEHGYESALRGSGSPAGAIFALKNFGWKDKTETDLTSNGEAVGIPLIRFVNPDKSEPI